MISHYRVIDRLGAGGMGEVYLARDTRLNRKVALKFLPDELQRNPKAHKRLLREARAAAALDHPYICKVYEIGEIEEKSFIAMEHVEGRTLADRLADGPLSFEQAVRLAGEIAEALDCAHRNGVVHRDLKPANIMLASNGHAKVLDFGLAKHGIVESDEGSRQETLTALTEEGSTVGTLPYMSPEQARGRPVDLRSDIFSFGVLLYEMLTGVQPFLRETRVDTAAAILHEEPPPLASQGEKAASIEPVLRKMLAKEPAARYAGTGEVRAGLAALQGASPRARRLTTLQRRSVAILLPVAAALLIGLWWIAKPRILSARQALAFTERDWVLIADLENLTGEEVFDHSLDTALTVGMQQSRYVNVFPRDRVRQALQRMRREDVSAIDEALGMQIAVREGIKAVLVCSISRIDASYSLGLRLVDPQSGVTVLSRSSTVEGREKILLSLDELSRQIRLGLGESLESIAAQSTPLPAATTASLEALKTYAEGQRLLFEGAEDEGEALLRRAVEIDPDFALAHAHVGMRHYFHGEGEIGDRHFRRALSLIDRLTTREQLWISALVEDWRGNREKAVESYRVYLAQYPDDFGGWFRLGYTDLILGRQEEAIEAFQRALELEPDSATARVNIATCLNMLGRDEEALVAYRKAFEKNEKMLLETFVNNEYGFLLVKVGREEEAREVFERMLAERDEQRKSKGRRSLGLLEMYRGRYASAIEQLREAIRLNQVARSPVSELRDRLYLASALESVGRREEAEAQVDAARKLQAETRMSPEWLHRVGKAYARMGRIDGASRVLDEIDANLDDPAVAASVGRTASKDVAFSHLVRGEIETARGNYEAALEWFELAAAIDETISREPPARCLASRGDIGAAIDSYERLRGDPQYGFEGQQDWILSHFHLARLYERAGEPDRAAEAYEALLEIWSEPDDDLTAASEARRRLAELRDSNG